MNIKRIFVEKKDEFNIEAVSLTKELKEHLLIPEIESLRILYRYDIENISDEIYELARKTIFSEPPVDFVFDENFLFAENNKHFVIEYLPGQYDQRADSASQCIQILTQGERLNVKCAKVVIIKGSVTDSDFNKIKSYLINPVDSREATNIKPK